MLDNQENRKILDFSMIFEAFKKYWKMVILMSICGPLIAFLLATFFLTPKYSSTVDFLVNQKVVNTQNQFTAQQADLQVINTYKDVVTKPVILKTVLKKARLQNNYHGSFNDLKEAVSINNETNSQVISVSVTNSNPYVARDIANSIGKTFTQKIKRMMKVDNITIVSKATANPIPVFPNKKVFIIVGFLAGFVVGMFVALLKQYLDNTVKDINFLTDRLGLVNLGQIYHISNNEKSFKVVNVKTTNKVIDDNKVNRRRV